MLKYNFVVTSVVGAQSRDIGCREVTLEPFSLVTALPRSMQLGPNPRFQFKFLNFVDFS